MRISRSSQIAIICLSFVVGLLLSHFGLKASPYAIVAAAILTLGLVQTRLRILLLAVLLLTTGIWYGQRYEQRYQPLLSHLNKKIELQGSIVDDPTLNDKGLIVFSLSHLFYLGKPLAGDIRVTGFNAKLKEGQVVVVSGKFRTTLGSKQGQITYAQITVVSEKLSTMQKWRQRFFAGMRSAMPEPHASFMIGLLLGARALIPKDLQDMLTLVGLSHLVAVSGYNLTIIVDATRRPLRNVSKFMALALPLWLIAGFTILTGFSASIVRAAIVSSLSLVAAYYGRRFKPVTIIAIAAAVTAAVKPDYIWSDLGWQLSFLAFFGIIVLAPQLQKRFIKRPNILKSLLVESLSAQLVTFPLIMATFGTLSVVSPLANLLILPLVPLAMFFGFIAGVIGMVAPTMAGWFAWPATLITGVMLRVISWLAKLPSASRAIVATVAATVALYGIIVGLTIVLSRANRRAPSQNDIIPAGER